VHQNEQVVAVVEAGYLDLTAGVTSVRAEPGQTATIPLRLTRAKGYGGDVKIELLIPAHIRGVSAEPVTLATDKSEASLAIRFSGPVCGPFNMPLTVRATLETKKGPVTAETRLDIASPRP
jgi:hypothetical protein